MPAGYSGTPLIRKLGLKPGMRARFINAPDHYEQLLGGVPDGVKVLSRWPGSSNRKTAARRAAPPGPLIDFIHLFAPNRAALSKTLPRAKKALAMDGTLWISWPKKSSSLTTDISEADIRAAGLDAGLVDVKICAVDDDWSGLKFVYRVKDRK